MITYNTDGVKMPKLKKREITKWIKIVADIHGRTVGEIGYLFVNDEKILECNRDYLGHDIVISLDTVHTNAEKFGKTYEEELYRVIIHGILHLCGINDKGPGQREIMEDNEDKALLLLREIQG